MIRISSPPVRFDRFIIFFSILNLFITIKKLMCMNQNIINIYNNMDDNLYISLFYSRFFCVCAHVTVIWILRAYISIVQINY